jgi:hypothetical protein
VVLNSRLIWFKTEVLAGYDQSLYILAEESVPKRSLQNSLSRNGIAPYQHAWNIRHQGGGGATANPVGFRRRSARCRREQPTLMQLAWIEAAFTAKWWNSVTGSMNRGWFAQCFRNVDGDVQQHEVCCLRDSKSTR